jgi:hypothetical protein
MSESLGGMAPLTFPWWGIMPPFAAARPDRTPCRDGELAGNDFMTKAWNRTAGISRLP